MTGLPGDGKKTAERLIVELRDKLSDDMTPISDDSTGAFSVAAGHQPSPVSDAVSALTALGYKAQEASRMVRAVDSSGLETEAIIRAALQGMVKG